MALPSISSEGIETVGYSSVRFVSAKEDREQAYFDTFLFFTSLRCSSNCRRVFTFKKTTACYTLKRLQAPHLLRTPFAKRSIDMPQLWRDVRQGASEKTHSNPRSPQVLLAHNRDRTHSAGNLNPPQSLLLEHRT